MPAKSAQPKLGFIGLGKMGAAMATNLVKAGFPVTVYNRTFSATEPLTALGATAVKTPQELAGVDVLFTMLVNHEAMESCVVKSGLLAAMASASKAHGGAKPIHVSCTTLPVKFVQEMVEQHTANGVDYVALPVMGRPDAAAAAKLHLLFAGDAALLPRLNPILVPHMGQSLRNFGTAPEKANVMKIAFNMMIACSIEAISEGCALVQRYDMEPEQFTSTIAETLFDCTVFRGYGDIIANRRFVPAGASLTGVGLKDNRLALAAGEQVGVPLPFASAMRDKYLEAIANGMGEWDWSAIAVVAEHQAGIHKKE